MSALTPSSDLVSQAGRAAHELGMAALLGGNLFGRLALHPSVDRISDPAERGEVVNAAWRRYGTINPIGLVAVNAALAQENFRRRAACGGACAPSDAVERARVVRYDPPTCRSSE
jgi:hypothetical protein